ERGREIDRLLRAVGGKAGLDLAKPRVVRGVGDDFPGSPMIRMPVLGVGGEDQPRPLTADEGGQGELVLAADAPPSIAEAESLPKGSPQDFGGSLGFARANLRGPSRSHLAARQIDDAEGVAAILENDQRPSAGELDVVGVGPQGENVNRHALPPVSPPPFRRCRPRLLPRANLSPPFEGCRAICGRRREEARAADRGARPRFRPAAPWFRAFEFAFPAPRPFARPPCGSVLRAAPSGTQPSAAWFRARPRASRPAPGGLRRAFPA